MLAESFAVPVNSRQQDTLAQTPWTMWTVWGQSLTERNVSPGPVVNRLSDVKDTYNSPLAITGGSGRFRGEPGLVGAALGLSFITIARATEPGVNGVGTVWAG
ncbi:hypothetical protein GCM10020229_51190 [Kitasatospora albolonga]|uniref:hypothetical protein n=1 Tax=Kitasatospora albolonga TaxID=68173 RepID=UPI0031E8BDBE